MNKKISKITTWLAVAVFLFALVINVKVTLDDPFGLNSNVAIAQTTSSSNIMFFESRCASCENEYGQSGMKFWCWYAWNNCDMTDCGYGYC